MKNKVKLNLDERIFIFLVSGMFVAFGIILIFDGIKEQDLYSKYLHFSLSFVIIPIASMYLWNAITGKL